MRCLSRGSARAGVAGILAVAVLAGCSPRPDIANRDSHGRTIICFGDSLTQGVGASPGRDYPSLLAAALGEAVINAGRSGETAAQALRRLERDVLERDPRLVIVEFGGNDFLHGIPLDETFANLEEIVRRIQEHGAMVVLVAVEPPLRGAASRQRYQQLARTRRAMLVPDLLAGVLANPSLRSDDIHPNDRGYEQIAQRMLTVITPLLR